MKSKIKKEEMLERIERTIADLSGCSDGEKIAAIGIREHDWVFANYEGGSPGTIISQHYMSAIDLAFPPSENDELEAHECWQKVNGKLIKRHKVVLSLMPTKEEWDDRNLKLRRASGERINSKLPLYPSPYLDRATELLNSKSWAAIAAGLIALTGRRPSEIAWCGEFEAESEYSLIFKGQLKKGKIEEKVYEIATLIDAETVLNGYKKLRDLQRNKTKILEITDAREADRKTNAQINLAIRKHFSGLIEPPADRKGKTNQISASNLRAAYGKIAAHFYCPVEVEPILYVGKILGHQCESYTTEALATTISYYTYYIDEDVTENDVSESEVTNVADVMLGEGKKVGSHSGEIENEVSETEKFCENKVMTQEISESESVTENRDESEVSDLREDGDDETKAIENDVSESETESEKDGGDETKAQGDVNESENESEGESKNFVNNTGEETNEDFANSATQLADRLGKSLPTIGRNRKKGDRHFASWSAKLDPDGVGWKYLKEGKLQSTGHDRSVNIYVPIADLTKVSKIDVTKNVSENARNRGEIILKGKELNRFQALASQLNFKGDRAEQLTQLFDWVESSLQKESVDVNKSIESKNVSKNDSDEKEDTIITAIATIADFSSNLKETIAPLTNELKRVVDKLDNLHQKIGKPDPLASVETLAASPSLLVEKETNPEIMVVENQAESDLTTDVGTTEGTSPRPQIMPLVDEDIKCTLDAIVTAIAMKRVAISKEKRKRSKIDSNAIATWEKEIESLQRTIAHLESS